MHKLKVNGGKTLQGEVWLHGAKNAALPIIAATLLFDNQQVVIESVPVIDDVKIMLDLLVKLGVEVNFQQAEHSLTLNLPSQAEISIAPPEHLVSKMRATLLIMGALLATKGEVEIALPGGCSIGYRPIDYHLAALAEMGAVITREHGVLIAKAPTGLKAANIHLDFPSVGATENIIMAAVLTAGTTTIDNAAKEPEVVDLVRFLNLAGAKITGAGTTEIKIEGVKTLTGVTYEIISDRIEAATYVIAAACTKGDIIIHDVIVSHLTTFIAKLTEIGVKVEELPNDSIRVIGTEPYELGRAIDVRTSPYPGFQTDMQVLILPLLIKAGANAVIVDNVFNARFKHVEEFCKIGAQLTQVENMLIVNEKHQIVSGTIKATDLRAAAAMLLLALSYDVTTLVQDANQILRGYEELIKNLSTLGADIEIVCE